MYKNLLVAVKIEVKRLDLDLFALNIGQGRMDGLTLVIVRDFYCGGRNGE